MIIAAAMLPTIFATASVYAFGGHGGPDRMRDGFDGPCGANVGGVEKEKKK